MESISSLPTTWRAGRVQGTFYSRRQSGLFRAGRSCILRAHLLKVPFPGAQRDYTKTRLRSCATGIFRRRTNWNRGVMRARMTARSALMQPLIAPLYDGKRRAKLWRRYRDTRIRTRTTWCGEFWKTQKSEKEFQSFWETALHDGVMAGTASTAPRWRSP